MKIVSITISFLFILSLAYGECDLEEGALFILNKNIKMTIEEGDTIKSFANKGPRLVKVIGSSQKYGCLVNMYVAETGDQVNTGGLFALDEDIRSLKKPGIEDVINLNEKFVSSIEKTMQAPENCCDTIPVPILRERGTTISVVAKVPKKEQVPIPAPRPKSKAKKLVKNIKISKAGLGLIKEFEGFSAGFHKDGDRLCKKGDARDVCKKRMGKHVNIPAIGHGFQVPDFKAFKSFCKNHLKSPYGTPKCSKAYDQWIKVINGATKSGDIINEKFADRLLRSAVLSREKHLRLKFSHLRLSQSQYDALISLMYNYPKGFRAGGGTSLYKELNKRPPKWPKGPNMINVALHMHDVGPRQGHFRRRLHEVNTFLFGHYVYPTKKLANRIKNSRVTRDLYKRMIATWEEKAKKESIERKKKGWSKVNPFWYIDPKLLKDKKKKHLINKTTKKYYDFVRDIQ
jgi:GH24 family phage-related lysozyme (muramidase)